MNRNNLSYFLPAAIFALALSSSCTKETVVDTPAAGKKIVIGLAGEPATRGTSIGSTSLLDGENIGMYVFHNRPGVSMSEHFKTSATAPQLTAEVEEKGTSGEYLIGLSPGQYWPVRSSGSSDETLEFFGWYPASLDFRGAHETSGSNYSGKIGLSGYTVPEYNADQKDMLVSIAKPSASDWAKDVSMHFHHALAQVTVSFARTDASAPGFTVERIELQNVNRTGNLSVSGGTYVSGVSPAGIVWSGVTTGTLKYSSGATGLSRTGADITEITCNPFLTLPTDFASNTTAGLKIVFDSASGLADIDIPFSRIPGNISWAAGEHVNYQVEIGEDGSVSFTARVLPWDEPPLNTILDGEYWLRVSTDNIRLNWDETGTFEIEAETNYNTTSQGFPEGIQVKGEIIQDNANIHFKREWFSVTDSGSSPTKRTIQVSITSRNDYTKSARNIGTSGDPSYFYININRHKLVVRQAVISVTAGNLTKYIYIEQDRLWATDYFARSNIILQNDFTLAFAATPADNDYIPANVEGLYFLHGSLVGIAPPNAAFSVTAASNFRYTYPNSSAGNYTAAFDPSAGATPGTKVYPAYADETSSTGWLNGIRTIPFVGKESKRWDDCANFDSVYDLYGPVGYDTSEGKGDICRYISDQGWVEGRWRLPVSDDFGMLYLEIGERIGEIGWTATAAEMQKGHARIPNGRTYGRDAAAVAASGNIESPGNTLFLPSTGQWDATSTLSYVDCIYGISRYSVGGYYGSASMRKITEGTIAYHFNAYADTSVAGIGYTRTVHHPNSIRCVRDTEQPLYTIINQ